MPFSVSLPRGLEFRLEPEGRWGWSIRVGLQADPSVDYVWVVSPPYQTAPHLSIGPVYGLTVRESAGFKRELRFVLNAEDYGKAFAAVRNRPMDVEEVRRVRAKLVKSSRMLFRRAGTHIRQTLGAPPRQSEICARPLLGVAQKALANQRTQPTAVKRCGIMRGTDRRG